jgi:hypothetical protein
MTDKEKQERKSLRLEIKARKLIIKKLETALTALRKTANRQKATKQAEREKMLEYKSYNDAQDAYGWGLITEAEFDKIVKFLESSQKEADEPSAEDIAIKTLQNWQDQMRSEIASIQFDLLPKDEQSKILSNNLKILEKRKQREIMARSESDG